MLLVTNISIKKVNNERYDMNLGRCGSSDIYSVEYKCTKVEIKVTTKSIITVNLSKQKDQLISTEAKWNHLPNTILKIEPVKSKVMNNFTDKRHEKSTESVLVIVEPLPVKNPKLLVKINPKRGKNTIESNIKFKWNIEIDCVKQPFWLN